MARFDGPTFMYDPVTGEGRVFHDSGEVPAGWLDHVPAPGEHKAARGPMSRKEITDALDAGGITYSAKAKAPELLELLTDSVCAALESAEIQHDPKADVRDLLALLAG